LLWQLNAPAARLALSGPVLLLIIGELARLLALAAGLAVACWPGAGRAAGSVSPKAHT